MSESMLIADGWSEWWDKLQEHGAIPAQESLLRLVFFGGAQHALVTCLEASADDTVSEDDLSDIVYAMEGECHEFFKALKEGGGT